MTIVRMERVIMIGKNDRISNFQMMILLVNTIIGVGTLSLPSTLAMKLNTGGWILLLISGFLVSILAIIITKLMQMYPGKTLVEIGRELIGIPLNNIIMAVFIIYLLGTSAFLVRIFAEVIKMFLLLNTPTEIIIITMLLTTSYIARCGIEPITRITLIITPIVFIPLFFIAVILLQDVDFTNLLPLFRFSVTDVIKAIPASFFSYGGFEFILIYMAFIEKPKGAAKYNVFAIVIVAVSYIFMFIITLTSFGITVLKDQLWPLLSLMKTIEFPGAFIENVDGVVMAIWVLLVFTTLAPVLYMKALIMGKVFRLKEHKIFVLPLIPIVFILSLIPDNLVQVYKYMEIFIYFFGTFSSVIVPIVFYIIAIFKNKRGAHSNEQGA